MYTRDRFCSSKLILRILLVCAALGLAACAEMPDKAVKTAAKPLVYPPPPDEPRFVFERSIYSSGDVVPDEAGSGFKRMVTGEARTGEGFAKPYAVAVRKGRIYLSDSVERLVKVMDVPSGRYFKIGEDERGPLQKPLGLDVDPEGNVYVADSSQKAVMVYDRDGKFLRKIGGGKAFERLSSVSVDPDGKRIYTVDIGGVGSQEHHRIGVYDAVSGKHLFDIGKRGKGPGEFNLPRDVAVGKDGKLYVVDGGNFRIEVFDHDGKYLQSWGSAGKQLGTFARPKEIAADPSGNIYVADAAFGNFQIFSPEGELLMFIGERNEQDGPGRYMLPSGIAVDEDGRVYFVDQWFRKVDVYRPANLQPTDGWLGKRPTAQKASAK